MTVPVIDACARQYPQLKITVLSREFVRPLFTHMPSNVQFAGADLKNKHKGLRGLNRLYKELRNMEFDAVADFHDVLRTKFLRTRFRLAGVPTAYINKGRKEKKALTNEVEKELKPLRTSFERYADVLHQLGLEFTPAFTSLFANEKPDLNSVKDLIGEKGFNQWIGIAPFAAHKGKVYPLQQMQKVIEALTQNPNYRIFLFGAGNDERAILEQWEKQYKVCSLAGKFKMDDELRIMSHLDVMLSMDSANMHLASLTGTPVLSIWGATHPYAGFMGWNQPMDNAIQLNMPCRPCSIYGNVPCMHEDYSCLTLIQPQDIVKRIQQLIDKKKE